MKNALFLAAAALIPCAGALAAPALQQLQSAAPAATEAPVPTISPAIDASKTPPPTPPNKRYKEALANNDGSTTIVDPLFGNPTGAGPIPISGKFSFPNGVCTLYGLGPAQAYTAQGDVDLSAAIAPDGRLHLLMHHVKSSNPVVTKIVCGAGRASLAAASVEERVEGRFVNDDGSVTLKRPFVAGPGSSRLPINAVYSSLTGICAYFGFKTYVTHLRSGNTYAEAVSIGQNGRINAFGYNSSGIDSIVCRN